MTTPAPAPIAISAELGAQLAPQVIGPFALETGSSGRDMRTITSVRAMVERPDHVVVEWDALAKVGSSTSALATYERLSQPSDFVDAQDRPLFGTYAVRLLVTFPGPVGEVPWSVTWFVVDPLI